MKLPPPKPEALQGDRITVRMCSTCTDPAPLVVVKIAGKPGLFLACALCRRVVHRVYLAGDEHPEGPPAPGA